MKKFMLLLLAAVLALSCVACGDEGSEGPEPGTPLANFYDAVMAAQPADADAVVLFPEQDPGLIGNFYPGLLDLDLDQIAAYFPPIVTHPCELVMVEVKNSGDIQKVKDIFNARIEMGSDNAAYPESSVGWASRAQVQEAGNFVAMIVLPEGNVIPDNIFTAD